MSPANIAAFAQPSMVDVTINYHLDPKNGGSERVTPGTPSAYRRPVDAHVVQAEDVRGREQEFSLDKQGFEFWAHPPLDLSIGQEKVKEVIYPEIKDFLKRVTGATRVEVIAQTTRTVSTEAIHAMIEKDDIGETETIKAMAPARYAHVDQSDKGSLTILQHVCRPEEVASLTRTRWGIINLWKPLKPIHRDPLALCDARSVPDSDLAVTLADLPRLRADPKGPISSEVKTLQGGGFPMWSLRENPGHKWYFQSKMTPEECLLLKIHDSSRKEGRAIRVPHCAITDPRDPIEDSRPRESTELRCLVFWEDEAP